MAVAGYQSNMAVEEHAKIDGAASADRTGAEAATADSEQSGIDALFCECGGLRRPTPTGELTCQRRCPRKVAVARVGLVIETNQQERHDLKILDEDDDEESPEYSRTKWCASCGRERPVRAWVVQMRSADEPPTQQYECRECGNRWREDG